MAPLLLLVTLGVFGLLHLCEPHWNAGTRTPLAEAHLAFVWAGIYLVFVVGVLLCLFCIMFGIIEETA